MQVIATYRDSDLGKDHPLSAVLADLRSHRGRAAHRPARPRRRGGRPDHDRRRRARARRGRPSSWPEEIADETDGNPFFVGEILRGLSESGALVFDEASARWSVDRSAGVALPESVREVIERRVERLGDEAREVLTLAAVIGRVFDLELLESMLDDRRKPAAGSPRGGGRRLAAGRVQTSGSGSSASPTRSSTRRSMRASGPPAARACTSGSPQALEDLYGEDPGERLSELALHWRLAAVSVDKAKAADYALRAGQRALESLAPAEALKLFTDAVELIGDVDSAERCEALIGLGEAQLQTGEAAYRETLLEAARIASALADAELAARAALANNRGGVSSTFGEVDTERLAAIERAIELDDPPNHARRARLLALKALELEWDPDFGMRRALAEEAISLARATEDTRTLAEVLRNVDETIRAPDTLAWRIGLVEELVGCAAEVGDPALRFSAHNIRVSHLRRAGGPRARKARTRAEGADRARARSAHDELVRHVHHSRLGAHARRSGRRRAPIRERVPDRAGGRTARRRLRLRRRAHASAYLSRPRRRDHRR